MRSFMRRVFQVNACGLVMITASLSIAETEERRAPQTSDFDKELEIVCEGTYAQPLRDIAADKTNIWWSFGNVIVKTDIQGKKTAEKNIRDATLHGITHEGEKVYAVYGGKSGESGINIYAADSLGLIKTVRLDNLGEIVPRDIAFDSRHFFVAGNSGKTNDFVTVNEYDPDFNFIKSHRAQTGLTGGAQNIGCIDGNFYIACFANRKNRNILFKFAKDFESRGKYQTCCSVGAVEIAPKLCLVGRTILKEYNKSDKSGTWIGLVKTARVDKNGIDLIGKGKLTLPGYCKLPDDYLAKRKKYPVPRNSNPYEKTDWDKVLYVLTSSHMHGGSQRMLDSVLARGVKFLTLSNYYPAIPFYPIKNGAFQMRWSAVTEGLLRNGEPVKETRNFQEIIRDPETGWQGEVEPSYQKKLFADPVRVLNLQLPADIVEAPNAEHYDIPGSDHITSPGSTFSSGHFDVAAGFRLRQHGFTLGVGLPWQMAFDRIFDKLIYEDGGGVILNHPRSSTEKMVEMVIAFLDFDPRVLGMEVFNAGHGWKEELWDKILSTGKQCYGFFTPDHMAEGGAENWAGVSVLLVPELTGRECLKAYRDGNFYGAIFGKGLKFTRIKADSVGIKIKTDKAQKINFITEKGIVKTVHSNEGEYVFPRDKSGNPDLIFVRVVAFEFADNNEYSKFTQGYKCHSKGEVIFSQPVIYKSL